MRDVYIYAKNNLMQDELLKLIDDLKGNSIGFDNCYTFEENRRSNMVYREIQKGIQELDVLVIQSLSALGSDVETVLNELYWIKEKGVLLVVKDFISTNTLDQKENMLALTAIIDVYTSLLGRAPVMLVARSKGGRKAIQYPDNWEDLYNKWISKEITAVEFMKESGLKKGSFYNMLNDYKQTLESNQWDSVNSVG